MLRVLCTFLKSSEINIKFHAGCQNLHSFTAPGYIRISKKSHFWVNFRKKKSILRKPMSILRNYVSYPESLGLIEHLEPESGELLSPNFLVCPAVFVFVFGSVFTFSCFWLVGTTDWLFPDWLIAWWWLLLTALWLTAAELFAAAEVVALLKHVSSRCWDMFRPPGGTPGGTPWLGKGWGPPGMPGWRGPWARGGVPPGGWANGGIPEPLMGSN